MAYPHPSYYSTSTQYADPWRRDTHAATNAPMRESPRQSCEDIWSLLLSSEEIPLTAGIRYFGPVGEKTEGIPESLPEIWHPGPQRHIGPLGFAPDLPNRPNKGIKQSQPQPPAIYNSQANEPSPAPNRTPSPRKAYWVDKSHQELRRNSIKLGKIADYLLEVRRRASDGWKIHKSAWKAITGFLNEIPSLEELTEDYQGPASRKILGTFFPSVIKTQSDMETLEVVNLRERDGRNRGFGLQAPAESRAAAMDLVSGLARERGLARNLFGTTGFAQQDAQGPLPDLPRDPDPTWPLVHGAYNISPPVHTPTFRSQPFMLSGITSNSRPDLYSYTTSPPFSYIPPSQLTYNGGLHQYNHKPKNGFYPGNPAGWKVAGLGY
ncbi:hypothetical protein TWF281_008675 [Arthrobotrys megalospora]